MRRQDSVSLLRHMSHGFLQACLSSHCSVTVAASLIDIINVERQFSDDSVTNLLCPWLSGFSDKQAKESERARHTDPREFNDPSQGKQDGPSIGTPGMASG